MKVGMVLMDGYCFCVGALDVFFIYFQTFLIFQKTFCRHMSKNGW
jgi:hypothetical protein